MSAAQLKKLILDEIATRIGIAMSRDERDTAEDFLNDLHEWVEQTETED